MNIFDVDYLFFLSSVWKNRVQGVRMNHHVKRPLWLRRSLSEFSSVFFRSCLPCRDGSSLFRFISLYLSHSLSLYLSFSLSTSPSRHNLPPTIYLSLPLSLGHGCDVNNRACWYRFVSLQEEEYKLVAKLLSWPAARLPPGTRC